MPALNEPSPHDRLVDKIRAFKRGAISPTDMWLPIFETLIPESAPGFLDSLADDLKILIRQEYFGLARYRFRPPVATSDLKVAQVIAQWCEQQGDPDALPN